MNAQQIVDTMLEDEQFDPSEMATDVYNAANDQRYLRAKAAWNGDAKTLAGRWVAVFNVLGIGTYQYTWAFIQELVKISRSIDNYTTTMRKAVEQVEGTMNEHSRRRELGRMIKAYVQGYDDNGNTERYDFDAEPWFEQASPEELKRLAGERRQGTYRDEQPFFFYSGIQTDNVWPTLLPTLKADPACQEFLKWCNENDCYWSVEIIDAQEVERFMQHRRLQKVATHAVDQLLGESNDVLADVAGAAFKPRTYYAYLKTEDGKHTVWMDKYGDPSETPQPFTPYEKRNRQNRGTWAYVTWIDSSELKENEDDLLHDVAYSALPDYKAQRAFDQAKKAGRTSSTAWSDALKALGYMPEFVAKMGRELSIYSSSIWAKYPRLAHDEMQKSLKDAGLPQSHIQALLRLLNREIGRYQTESQDDDILRDVAMVGANPPWIIAKRAWDQEVRYGSGENPWHVVLGALGYTDETARDVGDNLSAIMSSASDSGRDGDPEDFENEWHMGWIAVRAELRRLRMPESHVDAIYRIWRTNGPNQEMWESEDEDMATYVSNMAGLSNRWLARYNYGSAAKKHYYMQRDGYTVSDKPAVFTASEKAKLITNPQFQFVTWEKAPLDIARTYQGESEEDQPTEQPFEPDDEMIQSVVAAGINPAFAIVDAIKNNKAIKKTQPARGNGTWEVFVEVPDYGHTKISPSSPCMVIIRARQYLETWPEWSALRKRVGGYFWIKPDEADKLFEPLSKMLNTAKKDTYWTGGMEEAYRNVIAVRYSPPRNKVKVGRKKSSDIYNQGLFKYYS